jgi:hypothetical protein
VSRHRPHRPDPRPVLPAPHRPDPRPVLRAPRRPCGFVTGRDRREDVRVAVIVAGPMRFTALAAAPFEPAPTTRAPATIAR